MDRAIGITVHTGWGACVVVEGSPARPELLANHIIEILGDSERFCFHRAAGMEEEAARRWIALTRKKALAAAAAALEPFVALGPRICAIVAKQGEAVSFTQALGSHPRIHTAEGLFYRDVFRDACPVPSRVVPPAALNVSALGKLKAKPWGRDQKLAALAAWTVMGH